ncbi:MAG TPA: hypothetical protein VLV49_02760 [Terriglobales bacterium]|nr:hypothetical protein [Terriglobales bacterium]
MAAKKKAKGKTKKAKSAAHRKPARLKKKTRSKPKAGKKPQKAAKAVRKKPAAKMRARRARSTRFSGAAETSPVSSRQAGDLQGVSDVELADSESAEELLEEGNAFEAGVVSGVEDADDRDEKPVRAREVPEDDVPEEYLDND